MDKLHFGLITALLIVPLLSSQAFAEANIEIDTFKTSINAGENILVVGSIQGATAFKPVSLTVTDPSGNVIYTPSIEFDGDGNFKYMINPTLPSFIAGTYTVEATHEDASEPVQIQFEVIGGVLEPQTPAPVRDQMQLDEKLFDSIAEIESLLDQVKAEYRNGNSEMAFELATQAADSYASVYGPLGELDKGLADKIRVDLGEELRSMMQFNVPADALDERVDDILEDLTVAKAVIPEFGPITMVILMAAISGIVLMSMRYKGLGFQKI